MISVNPGRALFEDMTLFFILTALKLPKMFEPWLSPSFSHFLTFLVYLSFHLYLFVYSFTLYFFLFISVFFPFLFFSPYIFRFFSYCLLYFVICFLYFLLFCCSCCVAADVLNSAENSLLICVWELFLSHTGSYEQSPRLLEAYGADGADSDGSAGLGESQLREDLADAMMESPGIPARDAGNYFMFLFLF